MFLQTILENSIANAGLTANSVVYRTGVNADVLYRTYLHYASILNRTDKDANYYRCSACESVIKKVLTGVYLDIDTENSGQVKLRSLAFEPNLEELTLSDEEVAVLDILRNLVLDNGMIHSSTTIGESRHGHEEKGDFEHLHIKLPMVAPKDHRPCDIEKYASMWNRNLQTYNPYDVEVIEAALAKIKADSKVTEMIKQRIDAFTSRYLQVRNASKVVQNHVKWLLASNAANVAVCKFYKTPAGKFLTTILEGGNYEKARAIVLDEYDSENYQRTIHKTSDHVSEQQMEIADKLLNELDLVNSLQRVSITDDNLSELTEGAEWSHTPTPEVETTSGPMSSLKTTSTKKPIDRVESGPTSMAEFLAGLDDYLTIKVQLGGWCALCLYSAQADQEAKSILRNGGYHNNYSFVRASNRDYLNQPLGELELTHLIDIDGFKSFVTAGRFGRVHIGSTPLFPTEVLPELHPIRKQIEIWANSTKMELPTNTVVGFMLAENLHTVRPKFIITKRDTPHLEQVVEIVMP